MPTVGIQAKNSWELKPASMREGHGVAQGAVWSSALVREVPSEYLLLRGCNLKVRSPGKGGRVGRP